MAVKRTRKKAVNVLPEPAEVVENVSNPEPKKRVINMKLVAGGVLAIALLVLFWAKTNSWPVVAMVGMRPITRFEVDQQMFKQAGKTQVDDMITEQLVRNELTKNKISVTKSEVDSKIAEIRTSIGTTSTLEEVLLTKGMTLADLEKQLYLQIGIEKLLANKITVTDKEIEDFLVQNKAYMTSTGAAQLAEARESIRVSKLREEINTWITELKEKNKVWKAPGL